MDTMDILAVIVNNIHFPAIMAGAWYIYNIKKEQRREREEWIRWRAAKDANDKRMEEKVDGHESACVESNKEVQRELHKLNEKLTAKAATLNQLVGAFGKGK